MFAIDNAIIQRCLMNHFSYTTTQLAENSYLVPYGQSVADHRRTIMTNESGVLLWNAFTSGASASEMLSLLQATYEASDEDLPSLEQDVRTFMDCLEKNGIFAKSSVPHSGYPATKLAIGPVGICFHAPKSLISTYFTSFEDTAAKTECCQELHILPYEPFAKPNGKILTRSRDLIIFETEDAYVYLPTKSNYIYEMHVTKDARYAYLYADMHTQNAVLLDELFHIIRFAFLMAAQQHNLLIVHSASILYHDKAYLFSGHSGAGKSTHTNLWFKQYKTPLLNGDLNMLGICNNKVICYGLPWCGTSNVCTSESHAFGSITFLFQATENKVRKLSFDEAVLQLTKRCINPNQTEQQLQKNLSLAAEICKLRPSYELCCTKDKKAVEIMRDAIDHED